jgi:hypothetical protein
MTMFEQVVVDISSFTAAELEPSEGFARLLMRVDKRTRVGFLGLDAIRDSVLEKAGNSRSSHKLRTRMLNNRG